MYIQTIMIVVSVATILEGINLMSNTSKTLVKFSIKQRTSYNKNIREALARNFSRTAKLLGITGIITGIICEILSINLNRIVKSNNDTIVTICLLVLAVATRFIVNTISKDIRE